MSHDLSKCIFEGVEFNGSFNGTNIRGFDFTGSYGVVIDANKVENCEFTDFTDVRLKALSRKYIKLRKEIKRKSK